jgi:hypothetical protein
MTRRVVPDANHRKRRQQLLEGVGLRKDRRLLDKQHTHAIGDRLGVDHFKAGTALNGAGCKLEYSGTSYLQLSTEARSKSS